MPLPARPRESPDDCALLELTVGGLAKSRIAGDPCTQEDIDEMFEVLDKKGTGGISNATIKKIMKQLDPVKNVDDKLVSTIHSVATLPVAAGQAAGRSETQVRLRRTTNAPS